MSSSPRGGRRLFASTLFDGTSAIDVVVCRDSLVNNVLHAADVANAKVLVDWNAPDTSLITGTPQTYLTGDTPMPAAGDWFPIAIYGPFDLSVRADGTPYSLVVDLEMASSVAAASVQVAVQVGPVTDTPRDVLDVTGENSLEWTSSPTTRAWLTTTSPTKLIVPQSRTYPPAVHPTTDVAGGEPREVIMSEVMLTFYGQSTAGVAEPRIYGVFVREYCGL
jgi:hypothetical protein